MEKEYDLLWELCNSHKIKGLNKATNQKQTFGSSAWLWKKFIHKMFLLDQEDGSNTNSMTFNVLVTFFVWLSKRVKNK